MSNRTNSTRNTKASFSNGQHAMNEVIRHTMENGLFGNIPEQLLGASRVNPNTPLDTPIKEALTTREIRVGNRTYETHLIGIPLCGQLGMALEPVENIQAILKQAQRERILPAEDGLILLDAPLPASTIQMMSYEDIYNLIPRLFERGGRRSESPILSPVLDAKINESDLGNVEAAIMVGLVYWSAGKPVPTIIHDAVAQQKLARIVERHLIFDRANPASPRPPIQALPASGFLDATRDLTHYVTQRLIKQLIAFSSTPPTVAEFCVMPADELMGAYQIDISLCGGEGAGEHRLAVHLNELRDGDLGTSLRWLMQEFAQRGITEHRVHYHWKTTAINMFEAEDIFLAPISIH